MSPSDSKGYTSQSELRLSLAPGPSSLSFMYDPLSTLPFFPSRHTLHGNCTWICLSSCFRIQAVLMCFLWVQEYLLGTLKILL